MTNSDPRTVLRKICLNFLKEGNDSVVVSNQDPEKEKSDFYMVLIDKEKAVYIEHKDSSIMNYTFDYKKGAFFLNDKEQPKSFISTFTQKLHAMSTDILEKRSHIFEGKIDG